MNLDFTNNLFNEMKNNKFVQNFINELQKYLNNSIQNSITNIKNGGITVINSNHNELITKYRDKMNNMRFHILNDYAEKTIDQGKMYYIYDNNSKNINSYNLFICENENSHTVLEKNIADLPEGSKIGSVLREIDGELVLDEKSTLEITQELNNLKDLIIEEQNEYLESKRIENHVYEISEKAEDRAWIFDITNGDSEAIEEIIIPKDLLENCSEGDTIIFKNGEYLKNGYNSRLNFIYSKKIYILYYTTLLIEKPTVNCKKIELCYFINLYPL